MRIVIGRKYKVTEGSGLDSNKIGRVIDPANRGYSFFKNIEPGRYKPFNHKREALLIDDNGNYFTMFKNRLIELGE